LEKGCCFDQRWITNIQFFWYPQLIQKNHYAAIGTRPKNGRVQKAFSRRFYPVQNGQPLQNQTLSISLYLPQNVYFCTQYKLNFTIMSDIATRVKKIIVDKLGVDEAEVTPEASFTNDLGADSLDTVELIMEFEKEFNISIPDEQAETITTVGQAVSYLEENAK